MRSQRVNAVLITAVAVATAAAATPAAARPTTQTLVFDAFARASFEDTGPAGPSPGDTERSTSRLRDASGHFVGTAQDTCVFTKAIPNDMLERCSGSAKTSEGRVTLSGVGHLDSMNPQWHVIGRSGRYTGIRGTQIYSTDIPLDPDVPLAAGRAFSIAVIKVTSARRLHVGVVPRPAANDRFIKRADAACNAIESQGLKLPGFPFSNFDPFHPDPQVLPQVGQFFDQPARHKLPGELISRLDRLGKPPASRHTWSRVLAARRIQLANENKQVKAALAADPSTFVTTVYQQSRDYNDLVFRSAVFGVQGCTFG